LDLEDCFRKKLIRKVSINIKLILSLIEMAEKREENIKDTEISSKNVETYISVAYESLRMILEAICISKGYKVTNHVCIGELLNRELYKFSIEDFNRFRYIRNGINYYGTTIELKRGEKIIQKILDMKNTLQKLIVI